MSGNLGVILPDTIPLFTSYQDRASRWTHDCFGGDIKTNIEDHNAAFLEEVLEAVQAGGYSESQAHQMVSYVFSRPVGDIRQEVGGLLQCLAGLCTAHGIDMIECAEAELSRIQPLKTKVKEKWLAKPKFKPIIHFNNHPVTKILDSLRDYRDQIPDTPGNSLTAGYRRKKRQSLDLAIKGLTKAFRAGFLH